MKDEGKKKDSTFNASPSSSSKRSAPDEFQFIERIRQQADRQLDSKSVSLSSLIPHPSSLFLGIGDDAAVIRASSTLDFCITADLLVEEIDFRRTTTRPRPLGHKTLAVSLSDIAAMGARPRYALLSLGVPRDVWASKFLEEFYAGFYALADAHEVTLIGGDVSRTPDRIVIDSIVIGEVKRGHVVMRAGARSGDHIYVTGTLGASAAGLKLLEAGAAVPGETKTQRPLSARAQLIMRHLRPTPRVAWGALLGGRRLASAMIDLSDGLSSDLAHLCRESGVGALVDAARIPVDPLLKQSRLNDQEGLARALDGGEDFELLFTVSPRKIARLPEELEGVPITHIGEVRDKHAGIKLIEHGRARALKPAGFVHFKGASKKRS